MSTRTSGVRETSQRPRVLVVDDHADSAELLAILLERSQYSVKTVGDSFAALTTALEFLPQIAIIDIGLPWMNGFELLKAMRAEPSLAECRFIAVTGYSIDEVKNGANNGAFDAHLRKPLDCDQLYEVIATQLGDRVTSHHT
jgi:CheY-like chemotaxis protein